MKKSVFTGIIAIAAITFTITLDAREKPFSSQKAANRLVDALQKMSALSYTEMIPSINELHILMKDNESLYGSNLQNAAQALTDDYIHNFLPEVEKAFIDLLDEGARRGIVWNKIQLIGTETDETETSGPTYFTIVILSKGHLHKIRIDKAFFVHGEFRVNQHIRFL